MTVRGCAERENPPILTAACGSPSGLLQQRERVPQAWQAQMMCARDLFRGARRPPIKGFMNKPPPSDLAFTPSVKAQQERLGSRSLYERVERGEGWATSVTPELAGFLAERDSFYIGTASAAGQP